MPKEHNPSARSGQSSRPIIVVAPPRERWPKIARALYGDQCCDQCGNVAAFEDAGNASCGDCERFQCVRCGEWHPWEYGGGDERTIDGYLCDLCALQRGCHEWHPNNDRGRS